MTKETIEQNVAIQKNINCFTNNEKIDDTTEINTPGSSKMIADKTTGYWIERQNLELFVNRLEDLHKE